MEAKIKAHFTELDLDIRKSKFSRFTDQKNTPDVISFISDCILNYISYDPEKCFTVKDIWNSDYFIKNVKYMYSKPSPKDTYAQSEYDKFIGQPCRLFFYAQILCSQKLGNKNVYQCPKIKILEYISLNEGNAFEFLYIYLKKVLQDSGFLLKLRAYKKNNTENGFSQLKSDFQKFVRGNTAINGDTEINRIFPKVLNIFAVKWNVKGTKQGHISKQIFYFSDLSYNEINWRDVSNKSKRTTRQEFDIDKQNKDDSAQSNLYKITKAKNLIKRIHPETEIKDRLAVGKATQTHHIFPRLKHPQFEADLENLIHLTPTQHVARAHPDNRTSEVDLQYQIDLLMAKSYSIEESLNKSEPYYDKARFIYMINACMNKDISDAATFDEIRKEIS